MGLAHAASSFASQFQRPDPRPAIRGEHVLQGDRVPGRALMLRDYLRHGVHDSGERDPAGPECLDADLVGRVVDGRGGAAGAPGLAGQPDGGERLVVQRLEGPGVRAAPVEGRPASGTRSGQARPSAIGIRMSGGLAWAMVAPSVNSTMEWITDCGCTTTSIRSNPMPNSRCASISSSPLLTSVAELIVTTGPMFQFGWARAWAGVTCSSSACCGPGTGRRSRSAPGGPPRWPGRPAGTARWPSARSRPARSGRGPPYPPPAGRPRSGTPCSPGPASGPPPGRPAWRPGRPTR